MAWCIAEARCKKSFDQLQSECRADHFSAEAEYVQIVILDALPCGEHVMNEPGANAGDLIRRNGCTHAAAAQRDTALDIAGGASLDASDFEGIFRAVAYNESGDFRDR
jgi:hypothetical protein